MINKDSPTRSVVSKKPLVFVVKILNLSIRKLKILFLLRVLHSKAPANDNMVVGSVER